MNNRHRSSLRHPLMTRITCLNKYLVDKSSQARKLVQMNYINSVLGKGCTLFYLGMQYLDGTLYMPCEECLQYEQNIN